MEAAISIDPNWITAVATAFTGLTGGIIAGLAWFAVRRDNRAQLPIVEPGHCYWEGGKIRARIFVRNRLRETLTIESAYVRRPRPSRIARREDGTFCKVANLTDRIRPTGDGDQVQPNQLQSGPGWLDLWIEPRSGWQSGEIAITLRISSMARTIRHKRIVTKAFVQAPRSSPTAANAKSQA